MSTKVSVCNLNLPTDYKIDLNTQTTKICTVLTNLQFTGQNHVFV